MPCSITIKGTDFRVREYMAETKLSNIHFWCKGDLTQGGKRLYKSGLGIQVSAADLANLNAQIRGTLLYLTKNQSELKKLATYRGVDEAYLSFAMEQEDEIALFVYFPADLVKLAGDIGLGIHICQFRCSE